MIEQKRAGIVVAYINILFNMCVNVFFTPFLISSLGDAEYGVYRIVQSLAGQLSIMTLGMATLVTRNIVYYNTKDQKREKENFLAMALVISVIMSVVVFIAGMIMSHYTPKIFSNSLSANEIQTAKYLIIFFTLNVSFTVINDCFAGMLTGHEKFMISNSIRTFKLILRVLTLIILLKLGFKSIAIVVTDLMLTILIFVFNMFYGVVILKEKIRYHYFDKIMFKTSMLFSAAILLQTVINQVNQNLDSLILGIMTDSKTVAIYSVALVIYTTYSSIPTVISSVFAPKATRMIVHEANSEQLTDFVSATGRYELMVAGAVIVGFILFGEEFICTWINADYLPVYKIALILIIPMTIPLVQGNCNAILDAQLRRMSRSVILGIMAIVNVIVSILLVKKIGYIGAAYGTAISVIVGHIVIMNIYLHKYIGLKIRKMFYDIFYKILPCIAVSTVISIPLRWISITNILLVSLVLKIMLFMIVYSVIMYIFGMRQSEKAIFKEFIKRVVKI